MSDFTVNFWIFFFYCSNSFHARQQRKVIFVTDICSVSSDLFRITYLNAFWPPLLMEGEVVCWVTACFSNSKQKWQKGVFSTSFICWLKGSVISSYIYTEEKKGVGSLLRCMQPCRLPCGAGGSIWRPCSSSDSCQLPATPQAEFRKQSNSSLEETASSAGLISSSSYPHPPPHILLILQPL